MTYNKKQHGFTLIELLVVIAIIGVISTIVLASLNTARMKSRDAKRISDLHQIRLALEMYYHDNGNYPVLAFWTYSTDAVAWNTLQMALSPYIKSLPVDPKNNASGPWTTGNYSYTYGYNTVGYPNKYDLVAQVEDVNNRMRCGVKAWLYHTAGGETSWCGVYSPYLIADH